MQKLHSLSIDYTYKWLNESYVSHSRASYGLLVYLLKKIDRALVEQQYMTENV